MDSAFTYIYIYIDLFCCLLHVFFEVPLPSDSGTDQTSPGRRRFVERSARDEPRRSVRFETLRASGVFGTALLHPELPRGPATATATVATQHECSQIQMGMGDHHLSRCDIIQNFFHMSYMYHTYIIPLFIRFPYYNSGFESHHGDCAVSSARLLRSTRALERKKLHEADVVTGSCGDWWRMGVFFLAPLRVHSPQIDTHVTHSPQIDTHVTHTHIYIYIYMYIFYTREIHTHTIHTYIYIYI